MQLLCKNKALGEKNKNKKWHLGALLALLKNLRAEPVAVEGNGCFGVRA